MEKVIVAKTAGFCMGVKRAVDMTLELIKKTNGPVYTYGPLIHNPQVIELLAKKGVIVLDKNILPEEGTVIIRTHGINPDIKKRFEESGVKIFDATCPFVKNVQRIIEEYSRQGYTIIIVGDKGHAEVDSYLGYANGKGMVVSSIDEVDNILRGQTSRDSRGQTSQNKGGIKGKICVVAQTTQDKKRFNEIVDGVKGLAGEVRVFDTICNATSKRQEEAIVMSKKVDAMVVVGGRNSANTLRLAELCKSTGTQTYFIEKAEELNLDELVRYKTIGITAGASTSRETIREVMDYINEKFKIA